VGRRSRFKIYVDVLAEIKSGTVLPTKIMYGANLNWTMLKKALEKLKAKGLIQEQSMEINKVSKRMYTLTERGDKVLNYLKKVNEILDPETTDIPI
jgi:predicted transcriptional regulator